MAAELVDAGDSPSLRHWRQTLWVRRDGLLVFSPALPVLAAFGEDAGDELLAVDGWRIRKLDDALAWAGREQPFELLLVRDQRVMSLRVRPDAAALPPAVNVSLHLQAKVPKAVAVRRRAWIDA